MQINKTFRWNEEKNQLLELQRSVSFEDVLEKIVHGQIVDVTSHPNKTKYPNQQIFIIEIRDYIWYVPFVESDSEIFLKTIIPSRKLVKEFGGKK